MLVCALFTAGATLHADAMLFGSRPNPVLAPDAVATSASNADWGLQREILEHAVMERAKTSWLLEPAAADERAAAASVLTPRTVVWRDVLDSGQSRPAFPSESAAPFPVLQIAVAGVASVVASVLFLVVWRWTRVTAHERDW